MSLCILGISSKQQAMQDQTMVEVDLTPQDGIQHCIRKSERKKEINKSIWNFIRAIALLQHYCTNRGLYDWCLVVLNKTVRKRIRKPQLIIRSQPKKSPSIPSCDKFPRIRGDIGQVYPREKKKRFYVHPDHSWSY